MDDLQSVPGSSANSKKKTLIASEQEREDVAQMRAAWKQSQHEIDPQRVVFIDETWAKTNMTRTYGRSEQGTRVIQRVPRGRWERRSSELCVPPDSSRP